jgi:methyl-accepting chemotaxis protein
MFKNIKVTGKIALMIAAVALPLIAATLFATIKGFNKDINFATQEMKGNAFQRPLAALLDALPRHQWLIEAAVAGNPGAKTELAKVQVEVDHLFAELELVNNQYGADLQFTDAGLAKRKRQNMDPRSVKAAWNKLKAQAFELKPEVMAGQHSALVASLRTMITHAGDTSNLILDPDLDSYYLMDATLIAVPQTQDRLAVIADHARAALADGGISPKESAQLAAFIALLKEGDVDRINGDINTALNEDAGFYGLSETLQKNLTEPLKAYGTACDEFIAVLNDGLAGNTDAQKVTLAGLKARDAAFKFWTASVNELDALLQKRAQSIRRTRLLTLLGVAAGLALSLLMAGVISRGITRPLLELTNTSEKISQGDYTARAPVLANDEIGNLSQSFNAMIEARNKAQEAVELENQRLQANIQDLLVVVSDASDGKLGVRARVTDGALGNVADALNLMLESVGELITNAKTTSTQVASAASDITTVSQELEKGEQVQSREIEITSSGVRDLNGQAELVLKNCLSANEATQDGRRAAEAGAKVVRDVIQGMEKIRGNTQANAKKIKRLGDRSMEIAGIVKVIADISAKTDMLALNASIEAARAGEQGRGFTVVAEQVRNLADRTRTLTNQIEKLVGDIQKETGEAVAQMETQTQEVEAGARAAEAAGASLDNIVQVSSRSSELVALINQAANQQASRTKEMLQTVESINRVVAAAQVKVRETRASSEQLTSLSSELNKRLAHFEVNPNN